MTPSDPAVESALHSGKPTNYVVELLRKFNLPVTRENYLYLAYPEGLPEELDETALPEEIRLTQRKDTNELRKY